MPAAVGILVSVLHVASSKPHHPHVSTPDGPGDAEGAGLDAFALAAALLAFASAAVTLYWLVGGSLGLATVGGEIEQFARERSGAAIALLALTLMAKLAAGGLALLLTKRRRHRRHGRLVISLGLIGGAGLALYGAVLVGAGALALAGAVDPSGSKDTYALRWHVFLWDLWFLLWGIALLVAAARARAGGERVPTDVRRR